MSSMTVIPSDVLGVAKAVCKEREAKRRENEKADRRREEERRRNDPEFIRRTRRRELEAAAKDVVAWLVTLFTDAKSGELFKAARFGKVVLYSEEQGRSGRFSGVTVASRGYCHYCEASSVDRLTYPDSVRYATYNVLQAKHGDTAKELFDGFPPLFLLRLAEHLKSDKVWKSVTESLKIRD